MPIESGGVSPSSLRHYRFLDGIRGIAILWVFLYHSFGYAYGWQPFTWKGNWPSLQGEPLEKLALFPLSFGGLGVAIFFALSGFCIHLSHLRNRDSGWGFFFYRRFFRLYPAYLVSLVLFFFFWPWYHFSLNWPSGQLALSSHLLGLHNLFLQTKFSINPSFWSIGTELQLYAIYPLLLLIMSILGWRLGLLATLSLEIFSRLMMMQVGAESGQPMLWFAFFNSPFAFWFSWAVGAYVAEMRFVKQRPCFTAIRFTWLVGLLGLALFYAPFAGFAFPLVALGTAVAIDRLIANRWQLKAASFGTAVWNHLAWLGIISYSLYLLHQPFLEQTKHLLDKLGIVNHNPSMILAASLILYPFLCLLSFLMYRLVERPCVKASTKAWSFLQRRNQLKASL